jgi:hypothetical protein
VAIPVAFYPGVGNYETGFTCNIFGFKWRRDVAVQNLSAAFADKVDVIGQLAVIAVLNPDISFKSFKDSLHENWFSRSKKTGFL